LLSLSFLFLFLGGSNVGPDVTILDLDEGKEGGKEGGKSGRMVWMDERREAWMKERNM